MFHLDSNLNFHIIESAPSPNVAKIERCLKKLREIQEEYSVDSAPVRSLLILIADLAKVKRSLLFDDVEGVLGAIASVNFSVRKAVDEVDSEPKATSSKLQADNEETLSLQEYHHRLVTQLVNTELCDLPSAIKITSEQPFKDVEGILAARIRFLNRDKLEKDKQEQQRQEMGKEISNELQDGSFFGAGFKDAIADAMTGDRGGLGGLL